jgi:hypothetical protein
VDQRKSIKGTKKNRKVIDLKKRNPGKQKKVKKASRKAAKGE